MEEGCQEVGDVQRGRLVVDDTLEVWSGVEQCLDKLKLLASFTF